MLRELAQKVKDSEQSDSDNQWMNTFIKYRNITELDRLCVVEMIKKIQIDDHGGIHITFRFEDQISAILNEISQEEQIYAEG